MYVIQRQEDGAFVAPAGSEHSYTRNLLHAQTFTARGQAEAQCCGNEFVTSLEDLMVRPL